MKKTLLILFSTTIIILLLYIYINSNGQNQSFFTAVPFFGGSGGKPSELPKTLKEEMKTDEVCFSSDKTTDGKTKITANAVRISEKLLGIAFYLDFDSKKAKYINYKNGNFFERAGGKPFYMIRPSRSGRITAGITLKRGDVLSSGSGEIISFNFDGAVDFSISNTVAATIQNGKRKNLDGIKWEKCD